MSKIDGFMIHEIARERREIVALRKIAKLALRTALDMEIIQAGRRRGFKKRAHKERSERNLREIDDLIHSVGFER